MANRNYLFNDASEALPALLHGILEEGADVPSRAGMTKEFTHLGITLTNPCNWELLVPERKPNIAAQIAESVWVLAGRDDMAFLSEYLPRAKDFSDDGLTWRAGYGARLRRWENRNGMVGNKLPSVDQLAEVVKILQADPTSRQAVMSIWDPAADYVKSRDIPCNDWLHFLGRNGKLDLHVAIRSNDAIWGWSGINQVEWSILLQVVAGLVNQEVGSLHFSVTSWHLYDHHWEKARKIADAPVLRFNVPLTDSPRFACTGWVRFGEICAKWFALEERIRTGLGHREEVDAFPEPMLQSWLRVLQWWWTGDTAFLLPIAGTRLHAACQMSVQPKRRIEIGGERINTHSTSDGRQFAAYVTELHNQKHAAYGNSWKKRGEMLGIMANIARKIDRLESGADTSDESQTDTAVDLLVYGTKARVWMAHHTKGNPHDPDPSDDTNAPNALIRALERESLPTQAQPEKWLTDTFTELEAAVMRQDPDRVKIVDRMLPVMYALAFDRWWKPDLGFVGGDHDLP